MRRTVFVPVVLSLLACGGAASVEAPEPPSPSPEPVTTPPPAAAGAPKDLHAVVVEGTAVVCWGQGRAVGTCDGLTVPEAGYAVTIVDSAPLGEGPVELTAGAGRLLPPPADEPCEMIGVEPPTSSSAWQHARTVAVAELPAAFANQFGAAVTPDVLYAVDFEGDGTTEVVFSAETDRGRVIGIVRDGRVAVVADDRRDPLPEDADEQARAEYEMSGGSTEIVGVTDAGLDGTLELVLEAEGYESVSWSVVTPTGVILGGAGCAI